MASKKFSKIRPGIDMGSLTDVGCHRENNEDRCEYWEPASDGEFARKGRLAIVADGMGGYEGGQEASRIAIQAVQQTYAAGEPSDPQSLLSTGIQIAHRQILEYASEHPGLSGMGTTCTAIAVVGADLYYAHVGDSRLYLIREGKISKITRDHSYVNRLVETGLISSQEAENHPHRNILTAAVGAGIEVSPEYPANPILLAHNDILLLCTDGLWGVVTDEEIQVTASKKKPQSACESLVGLAKERGGPDNITLMILLVRTAGDAK
ncbi:MAG: Stp1/IreP family PP2C-type Ser/Thr phosphatase [Terriglobales bacterium]